MKNDPRECIELILPDGLTFLQRITFEHLPKICHTCHAFGHVTAGCPGLEERERIRLENRKWELSRLRATGNNRGQSRGRDASVRASANSTPHIQNRVVVTHAVWKPSGKNQTNAYKGDVPSTNNVPITGNRFQALQDEEAACVDQPQHGPLSKDKGPDTEGTILDARVEDSESEELGDANCVGLLTGPDVNVTLRGDTSSTIDPIEYPSLIEAASSGKKKNKSGGLQGRKHPMHDDISTPAVLPNPVITEGAATATMAMDDVARDPSPPIVRHRSKSRGPKRDITGGSSAKKKIAKNKRSLSCNNRPLGVSDLIPPPQ